VLLGFLRHLFPLALAVLLAPAWASPLHILVEPYPPFVVQRGLGLGGPYVDAFAQLAKQRGLVTTLESVPMRRALKAAQAAPGTCVLGVNYAAADAEVLLYVSPVAPVYIWAYSRHGANVHADTLAGLGHYSLGVVDIPEIRQLLEGAGLRYEYLPFNGKGLQMLQASRFDVLLSDVGPELGNAPAGTNVDRLFLVTRVERWLACNPATDPTSLAALRAGLHEGLFPEETRDIWSRYGLGSYFDTVRKEWVTSSKMP